MQPIVPRVAAIHDLSGFGRTSLTVVIPILSVMGIQVCPLPTAVLSSHTAGFDDFSLVDLSPNLPAFLDHWQRLSLHFDAVYSGFLSAPEQAEMVARCIDSCLLPGGIAMVDPVLGDNGVLDPTMTPEIVARMRWLIGKAQCITPNITEAAFLLDEACVTQISVVQIKEWLVRLAAMGPNIVVVTSVPLWEYAHKTAVVAYQRDENRFWQVDCSYIPAHYPGTGDIFASVLLGSLLQGDCLPLALDRAVQFVTMGIRATFGYDTPCREGIALERILDLLRAPLATGSYRLLDSTEENT